MLRGLGFSQQKVADKIGCSRRTVQNYLHKFKKEAQENGIENTFWFYFGMDSLSELVQQLNKGDL